MSIKIFAGAAKGFTLAAPRHLNIRPTSIQLRRKLFDSVQDMSEEIFIDLCCGSGAMGLEALSRGVRKLILVDTHTKLAQTNVRAIKDKYEIETPTEVIKSDCLKWMNSNTDLLSEEKPILFFDPPYEKKNLYENFMSLPLEQLSSMTVIEGCEQKTMRIADFEALYGKADKSFQQGTSYFLMYRFNVR